MIKEIHFSTAQGEYNIESWRESQTIREICIENKIPFQSISIYLREGDNVSLYVGLDNKISEISAVDKILILKSIHNTNYEKVTCKDILINKSNNAVTEYSFPSENTPTEIEHFEMSISDCKKYVLNEVTEFAKKFVSPRPSSKVIVGISGGGDSNVLIESLILANLLTREQIIPIMLRGIPGSDQGVERARKLCNDHSLNLIEINQSEINSLLGRKTDNNWVKEFKKIFPQSDVEIIGTLAIRLALFDKIELFQADAAILGLNLEDLLGESLLRTMQGLLPLPFPVRLIEDKELWFPLYNIPKKIIDGCNPEYSLNNYLERIPNAVVGRDIGLYLTQTIPSIIPGVEFDLLSGFQKLSILNANPYYYDKELGMTLLDKINLETRNRWLKYINK